VIARKLRENFPYKPNQIYEFGEAMSYPFEDDGVWIFARKVAGDPTTARYVPLDKRAKARGWYSPVKDMLP
jgi:hypothetical protein